MCIFAERQKNKLYIDKFHDLPPPPAKVENVFDLDAVKHTYHQGFPF